jgi:hypothetical protein
MTVRQSIVQARTFSKVCDSASKQKAFNEYAREAKKLVKNAAIPRHLIWCPCKAPAYFKALEKTLPAGSPARALVKKLLAKL